MKMESYLVSLRAFTRKISHLDVFIQDYDHTKDSCLVEGRACTSMYSTSMGHSRIEEHDRKALRGNQSPQGRKEAYIAPLSQGVLS